MAKSCNGTCKQIYKELIQSRYAYRDVRSVICSVCDIKLKILPEFGARCQCCNTMFSRKPTKYVNA